MPLRGRRLPTGWLRFLLGLGLASMSSIAVGTSELPVHAAPAVTYRYILAAAQYRSTICFGESAKYSVYVNRDSPDRGVPTTHVDGYRVGANPNQSGFGSFIGGQKSGPLMTAVTGPGGSNPPMPAVFTFKAANKAGSTSLNFVTFNPVLGGPDLFLVIPITIKKCEFTISGTTRFPPDTTFSPLPAPPLVAQIKPAPLSADDGGHLTGLATIHWVSASASASVGGARCTALETFGADGEVQIDGDVIEPGGLLKLTFVFSGATGNLSITCAGEKVNGGTFPYVINSFVGYTFTKGGVFPFPITYNDDRLPGSARIVVKAAKN
jgi:hypothetical protein